MVKFQNADLLSNSVIHINKILPEKTKEHVFKTQLFAKINLAKDEKNNFEVLRLSTYLTTAYAGLSCNGLGYVYNKSYT